jgi:hypothetical protein
MPSPVLPAIYREEDGTMTRFARRLRAGSRAGYALTQLVNVAYIRRFGGCL